ncbi:apolipoprotein N-acyltransferase [Microbacterium horticulturae]|uniref:Apolipoprotein N-acyltransferase n=1 Tax=Microbacterium horticulturae TaxID=3028316 RepID=A0ABY8C5T2_9MICO|nr:apolipoprotein N-acyltransferase [Microbacterium sp. KACC 23027]WEG10575.1 apolipoprotein N-acyltransferase [Microbacterium sp. KACC 23027]
MPDARALVRPVLPLGIATFTAVVAGALLTTAFPALSWWPMVFVAVPLTLLTLIGRRAWAAFLVGFAFGIAFFLINVSFTGRYLGPVPWVALSVLEALLTAAGAVPIAWAYRWMPRLLPARWARVTLLPALVAGLWTMRELLLGSFPYGGFPWGRIGITQVNGPLAQAASWVGVNGLTFLAVFVCAAVIEYARVRRPRDLRLLIAPVLVAVVTVAVPQFPTTAAGTLRVGAVQGNGPTGYFDRRGPNDVLQAQLDATAPLLGKHLDVLLWPEGSMDTDPTQDSATAAVLDGLSRELDAPLIVAAVTQRGDAYFNSSLLWKAGAQNPVQTYDKRHPVPFGEYVPDRWLYRLFAPDLIDLIQREYTPGTSTPVFDLGDVRVGLAICFDVIYDDVIIDGANGGAEVFMFQTNNADFRGTDENLQQLAFARMRAIETGRAVVNISTVGTSQMIAPDGSEIAGLTKDKAGSLLEDVPLRTGLTSAVVIGPALSVVLGWGSLLALVMCGVLARLRRPKTTDAGPDGTGIREKE